MAKKPNENRDKNQSEIKRIHNTFIYCFFIIFLQTTALALKDKLVNKLQ